MGCRASNVVNTWFEVVVNTQFEDSSKIQYLHAHVQDFLKRADLCIHSMKNNPPGGQAKPRPAQPSQAKPSPVVVVVLILVVVIVVVIVVVVVVVVVVVLISNSSISSSSSSSNNNSSSSSNVNK